MRRPSAAALFWPATALALASIVFAAAPLPWRFAGDSGLPPPSAVPGQAPAPEPVSIEAILRLAPFGRVTPPEDAPAPAEETALSLVLHGVAIAATPARSSAIVSTASEPPRVYAVGAAVTETATLEAVFEDHVVLRVDGNLETLSFPEAGAQ